MIDLLMIVLQFAPVQSTGAFRSIEFVKRLPALGVRPTVLTIEPEQAALIFGGTINSNLSDDLPDAVDIHYLREVHPPVAETPRRKLWRMLTSLDDTFERRFAAPLEAKLTELRLQRRRFDAVYTSAPPFGSAMLGKLVAEELRLPYLIDMRDAWAEWCPGPQVSRVHYLRKKRDESRAFYSADAIVSVTPELTELFSLSHPEISSHRFHTITNGLSCVEDVPDYTVWDGTTDNIDIGYIGSFYWNPPKKASFLKPHRYIQYDPGEEDWSYRSPLFFFRAWAELDKRAPEIGSRFRFHHVGHVPDWLMPMAEAYGLAEKCVCHGILPKQDIVGFLEKMNCVLGTSMKRSQGTDYCLATKSFDYLASGKPTLAFVCAGAQKRFYEEVGGAIIFEPDNPEISADILYGLVGLKRAISINKEVLELYDHNKTSEKMALLIHKIARSNNLANTPHAS